MSNLWATHTKVTVDEILRVVIELQAEVKELKEIIKKNDTVRTETNKEIL